MKNVLKLGKALSKAEQKIVFGGFGDPYIGSGCESTCDPSFCRELGFQNGYRGVCEQCTNGAWECRLYNR